MKKKFIFVLTVLFLISLSNVNPAEEQKLLGYGAYHSLDANQFDYTHFFDILSSYNINLVKTFIHLALEDPTSEYPIGLTPFVKVGDKKFDLTQFNSDYMDRLNHYLKYAENKGIVVQLVLFHNWQQVWDQKYNVNTNVNLEDSTGRIGPGIYNIFNSDNSLNDLGEIEKGYVQKIVMETKDDLNVIYELMNEHCTGGNDLKIVNWHKEVASWIKEVKPSAIITTSSCVSTFSLPEIDYISLHYGAWQDISDPLHGGGNIANIAKFYKNKFGKSVLIDDDGTNEAYLPDGTHARDENNDIVLNWARTSLENGANFMHKDGIGTAPWRDINYDLLNQFRTLGTQPINPEDFDTEEPFSITEIKTENLGKGVIPQLDYGGNRLYLVYLSENIAGAPIYFKIFDGSWSDKIEIPGSSGDSGRRLGAEPKIKFSNLGKIYFLWGNGENKNWQDTFYSVYNPSNNNWDVNKVNLRGDEQGKYNKLQFDLDNQDNLIVAGMMPRETMGYSSNGKWIKLNQGKEPIQPVFDSKNIAHLFWNTYAEGISYAKVINGVYSGDSLINKNVFGSYYFSSVDSKDNIHLAYAKPISYGGSLDEMYYIEFDGTKWGNLVKISENSFPSNEGYYPSAMPKVIIDKNDNIYVSWNSYGIVYLNVRVDGRWIGEMKLTPEGVFVDTYDIALGEDKFYVVFSGANNMNMRTFKVAGSVSGSSTTSSGDVQININPPRISPGSQVTVKVIANEDYYLSDKLLFCVDDTMYSVQMDGLYSDQQNWIKGNAEVTFTLPQISSLPVFKVYACKASNEWICDWYAGSASGGSASDYDGAGEEGFSTDTTAPEIDCILPGMGSTFIVKKTFDPASTSGLNDPKFTIWVPEEESPETKVVISTNIEFRAGISDNFDIEDTEFTLDGTSLTTTDGESPCGGSKGVKAIIPTDLEAGEHTLTLKIWDTAGNTIQERSIFNYCPQYYAPYWSIYKYTYDRGAYGDHCSYTPHPHVIISDLTGHKGYLADTTVLLRDDETMGEVWDNWLFSTYFYLNEGKSLDFSIKGNDGHGLAVYDATKPAHSGALLEVKHGGASSYASLGSYSFESGWYLLVATAYNCGDYASLELTVNGGLLGEHVDLMNPSPISKTDQGYGGGGGEATCFVAGTKVLTNEGEKNIEEIGLKDKIVSFDLNKKEVVVSSIKEILVHDGVNAPINQNSLLKIRLSNGEELKVTPEHLIYLERKWVSAGELKVGDKLFGLDDEVFVKSINLLDMGAVVYNLETNHESHNYFADGILVHNSKKMYHAFIPAEFAQDWMPRGGSCLWRGF